MAKKKKRESKGELQKTVERLFELSQSELPPEAADVFIELRAKLTTAEVRAAQRGSHGWVANTWVKKGILLGHRLGQIEDFCINQHFRFYDRNTFPPRKLEIEDGVRVVPGGSSIRDGAFIGRGVVCMPPMFINVGAYVGEGTMIDSNSSVGVCAQIGKHVHLSAGTQIAGVLEPLGGLPVIIEDDVFIGGNCGLYEGTLVKRGAVLAPGTILTRFTPVYDLVNEIVLRGDGDQPLSIPRGAVVIPGSRPMTGTDFATREGLLVSTPVITKYRDPGTNAMVALGRAYPE